VWCSIWCSKSRPHYSVGFMITRSLSLRLFLVF
jgi:hypothetical protein